MNWIAKKVLLLTSNSIGMEEQVVSERDNVSKKGEFVQPPTKEDELDDEKLTLIWSIQKYSSSKGKEKVMESRMKVIRT